jgi:hypothetical protein
MLGPVKPRRLDEPVAVSLEDLVPPDHFYRHLEAKLDLALSENGRRSATPTGAARALTRSSSSSSSSSYSSRGSAPSASS